MCKPQWLRFCRQDTRRRQGGDRDFPNTAIRVTLTLFMQASQPMTLVKILTALLIPIFASQAFGDSGAGASTESTSAASADATQTTGAGCGQTQTNSTCQNNAALQAIASVVNACDSKDSDCDGTPATYYSRPVTPKNMLLVNEGMRDNQPLFQPVNAPLGYGFLKAASDAVEDFRAGNMLAPTDRAGCEQDNIELGSKVTYKMLLNRGDCPSQRRSDAIRDPRTPSTTSSGIND
jgi:hypothetical protein